MSIRFHASAPIVTLYHDARSSQSQQALALIRQAQRGSPQGSSANANDGSGAVFLKEASSPASSSLDLQLEVRERQKEPPTPGQTRTILEYLKASPSSSLAGAAAAGAAAATTSAAPENHPAAVGGGAGLVAGSRPGAARPQGATRTRVKTAQQSDDASLSNDEGSVTRRLESSPLLLVDWDAGRASTDLAGVQEMIERWRQEQATGKRESSSSADSGGKCIVM